jgi:hypothetical protein
VAVDQRIELGLVHGGDLILLLRRVALWKVYQMPVHNREWTRDVRDLTRERIVGSAILDSRESSRESPRAQERPLRS